MRPVCCLTLREGQEDFVLGLNAERSRLLGCDCFGEPCDSPVLDFFVSWCAHVFCDKGSDHKPTFTFAPEEFYGLERSGEDDSPQVARGSPQVSSHRRGPRKKQRAAHG